MIELHLAKGSSVNLLLKKLKAGKVLSPVQVGLFRAWIRWQDAEKKIQAGEYRFRKNITPRALLQKWVKGDVILYSVTLPEGITLSQGVAILKAHPKIKSSDDPAALQNEGLFFPDTYYFPANTSLESILNIAQKMMQEKINKAWETRHTEVLKTPYEALILASIIEKETAIEAEKPLISGVFQRRLVKKMPLQADPTVVYGLQASYKGKLSKQDLKNPTPYNTYVHRGLPPTPIALSGMGSIEAALNPDQSDYLYFVAKGDGTHHFSATLPEHNAAVKKYQKEK